ncbi:18027_t:CDS:2 [Acaulospora morrowiae]|uniref:18027_t:CDS:1 n=1 Tax=Acaulospora morrowiae TaxID=94023 RepID=A0A9N9B241_9GLOM|nr:18027_t:CDS:2 [Acaulospora morrowiae]
MSSLRKQNKSDSCQKDLAKILSSKTTTTSTTKRKWSFFNEKDLEEASELTRTYYILANDKTKDDPIKAVLEKAAKDVKTKDAHMVQYSLMTFITHHPEARKRNLHIPPLTQRSPGLSLPKNRSLSTPGPFIGNNPTKPATDISEDLLYYWREDPNFNEHHEHWHIIYPVFSDDPEHPEDRTKQFTKDRQGEIFAYMHRQMLARYDAERIGVGLKPVKPLDNYNEVIPEPYNPSEHLVDSSDATSYAARPANQKLKDVTFYNEKGEAEHVVKVSELETDRDLIIKTIKQGYFDDPNKTKLTPHLIGLAIEAGLARQKGFEKYGAFHNNGHILLGFIADKPGVNDRGVMGDVRVSARDPIFWRWHRHVDDLYNLYQETLGPHNFDDCPPVNICQNGIILTFKDKIPNIKGLKDPQQDNEATKWGELEFGGRNFDKEPNPQFATSTLETKMKTRVWTWIEDDNRSSSVEYLFPREWYYFFRVENTSNQNIAVTFRVFFAPDEFVNKNQNWIELDKFKQELPARKKVVIARDCDRSSVVRQPPQKTENELDDTVSLQNSNGDKYCDCGWPFHLLLPRGTRDGLKGKLLVFISDWAKDEVPQVTRCGSLSLCGAEKPKDKYPDKRTLGYPFDRPFKNGSFEKTFKGLRNVAYRDVCIRWVENFPDFTV